MRDGLTFIIIGFLFVFLRFDVGIDLLPDPIGYLLISIGLFIKLAEKFPVAKKAGYISAFMILLTLPTIFVDVNQTFGFWWNIYSTALIFLDLILVYFIFQVLILMVSLLENELLIRRTRFIFKTCMFIHLILLAYLSFSVNIPIDYSVTMAFFLMVLAFVMSIVFLIHLFIVRSNLKNSQLNHY